VIVIAWHIKHSTLVWSVVASCSVECCRYVSCHWHVTVTLTSLVITLRGRCCGHYRHNHSAVAVATFLRNCCTNDCWIIAIAAAVSENPSSLVVTCVLSLQKLEMVTNRLPVCQICNCCLWLEKVTYMYTMLAVVIGSNLVHWLDVSET